MRINIGVNDKQRGGVITVLNTLLGDEFVLYAKTRRFHWNVTGPQFADLHKFFETQYETLSKVVDESPALAQFVTMREELRQLWTRTNVSAEQLVVDLQSWCRRAEERGIAALKEFSFNLRAAA